MKNPIANISQHTAARVAGFGILIWIITGAYLFSVLNSGITEGIPGEKAIIAASNIKINEWLLSIVIASILIIIACNVVVALALYVVLKPVNKNLTLLAAVFRLTYAIIFAITMVFLFIEPLLFSNVFAIGQMFYALHIIVLGYVIFKSGYFPRIMGVLLIIGASLGYLTEDLIHFFLPTNYVWIAFPGIVVVAIAEISLCFWLLLKGAKIPEMNMSEK